VVDNWFKTNLHKGDSFHKGSELGIANTHEEALTNILKNYVNSYQDLPLYIYQIQNKFRNELRAKSGIMRTREFLMKDLYSFSRNEDEFREFYEKCAEAYLKIYDRAGIGHITYRTFASGGSFSRFSDEFQTISDAGEDTIYIHEKKRIALNKEVYNDEVLENLGLKKEELVEKKAIEVGNIFPLGNKFSDALGLKFTDEKGENHSVIMGSYGIGLGRLLGTIVEVHNDDRGVIWPKQISPYTIHLITLGKEYHNKANKLIDLLEHQGYEVLWDDREDISAGEKFADADLIGIPWRLLISTKSIEAGGYEIKRRSDSNAHIVKTDELLKLLAE
jgi:prolyl-tRNA synthetase